QPDLLGEVILDIVEKSTEGQLTQAVRSAALPRAKLRAEELGRHRRPQRLGVERPARVPRPDLFRQSEDELVEQRIPGPEHRPEVRWRRKVVVAGDLLHDARVQERGHDAALTIALDREGEHRREEAQVPGDALTGFGHPRTPEARPR